MESPAVPDVKHVELPNRPGQQIAYSLSRINSSSAKEDNSKHVLIVFVNGLGLPQAFWQPALDVLKQKFASMKLAIGHHDISLLTYDRYGQGLSRSLESPPKPHDVASAAYELDSIIRLASTSRLGHAIADAAATGHQKTTASNTILLLVAHSIGVPVARLYCERKSAEHHDEHKPFLPASALLCLDSNMANSDSVSVFPDPASHLFDPHRDLPPDTTPTQLEWTRANYHKFFHPSTPNPEGLDRSTLAHLLPRSDAPLLVGPDGDAQPYVTVVSHDPEAFEKESLKISTAGLTRRYMEPAWHAYNQGLLKIGRPVEGKRKVAVARGAGHFVQRDNPDCVADEVLAMLEQLLTHKDGPYHSCSHDGILISGFETSL